MTLRGQFASMCEYPSGANSSMVREESIERSHSSLMHAGRPGALSLLIAILLAGTDERTGCPLVPGDAGPAAPRAGEVRLHLASDVLGLRRRGCRDKAGTEHDEGSKKGHGDGL